MAVYTETINMDGNLADQAKRSAGLVAELTSGLKSAEAALLRTSALGDAKGIEEATAKIGEYKTALDKLPPAILASAQAHTRNEFLAKKAAKSAEVAAEAQVAAAVESAKAMDKAGEMISAGASAIAEAALVATVALATLVATGLTFAISANEAQRAADSLFDALGQGAITGAQVGDIIDGLRAKTGIAADGLEQYAKAFLTMGVTGTAALESLTLAAASAEAIAKGGGKAFTALFQKIQLAADAGGKLKLPLKTLGSTLAGVGLNVNDLAKEMGITSQELTAGLGAGTIDAKKFGDAMQAAVTKKGAGPLKELASTAANLGATLQEYLGELFEDLGDSIGPFMTEVKSLFAIFDSKTNPSGKALKAGIGAFFKEVFGLLAKGVPYVKRFFLDVIIFGLQAYIALKSLAAQIKAFAESEEGVMVIEQLKNGLMALGIVVGTVIAVVALFVAMVVGTIAVIAALAVAVSAAANAMIVVLTDWAIKASIFAGQFIDGLVQGITAGAERVIAAVKNLASKAGNAFKGALGIQSPSKVMAAYGGYMGEGVALGLDGSVSAVESSSTGVATAAVEAVADTPLPGAAPSSGGAGGGVSVTLEAGAIVIQGGSTASMSELTEQAVTLIFERIAAQQGFA
jgi:hypothetical protein